MTGHKVSGVNGRASTRPQRRSADDTSVGDATARDWLSKGLLGSESRLLAALAAEKSGADALAVAEREFAAQWQKIETELREAEFCSLFRSLHS